MNPINPMPPRTARNLSLLPVVTYASADGHEWEVLEGDDGRLVVSVDGLLPYSFTAGPGEEPEKPPRHPLHAPAGEPN